MGFLSDCDDQLTGPNCSTPWIEELAPFSYIFSYTLAAYFFLLGIITLYLFFYKKLYSCANFQQQERRLRRASAYVTNHRFKTQLIAFIFIGAIIFDFGHAVYFFYGMLLEFNLDTPEGLTSTFLLVFSLSTAFSVAFCVTTVLQISIVSPIRSNFNAVSSVVAEATNKGFDASVLELKIIQAEDMKGVFRFLGPIWVGWLIIFACLFAGVFPTPIILFRVFVGYSGIPLILQLILVRRTGRNLFLIIDQMLANPGMSQTNREKYETVRFKMNTYVQTMTLLFGQNSVMVLIIGATRIAQNLYVFFVIALILGISLACVGTLVIFLFTDVIGKKSATKTPAATGNSATFSGHLHRERSDLLETIEEQPSKQKTQPPSINLEQNI